jgi:hypothetical protein
MEKCWSDGGSTGSKPSFCGFSAHLARARVGPVKISTETGILTCGKWLDALIWCRIFLAGHVDV